MMKYALKRIKLFRDIRIVLTVLFLWIVMVCMGQSSYQMGLLPSYTIYKKLPKNFKLSLELESRQELKHGFFNERSSFNYDYLQTDVTLIGLKKVATDKSVGLGYLLRFKGDKIVNRSIQQFILKKKSDNLLLGHRLSTDQTFEPEEQVVYRIRYRLSVSLPINGNFSDPSVMFFKVNNEYLHIWQGDDNDVEVRLVPVLAFKFDTINVAEIGLDYRIDSFIHDSSRSRFWFIVNWYMSF